MLTDTVIARQALMPVFQNSFCSAIQNAGLRRDVEQFGLLYDLVCCLSPHAFSV